MVLSTNSQHQLVVHQQLMAVFLEIQIARPADNHAITVLETVVAHASTHPGFIIIVIIVLVTGLGLGFFGGFAVCGLASLIAFI